MLAVIPRSRLRVRACAASLILAATSALADEPHRLDTVVARGLQPTSLPVQLPTTTEGISASEILERVNATDAEDALKYLPSLLVRKRYIGDYDHAVLATRASGTGNSARSLVYADGVLLSNLLGNGAGFTPRWGLVAPEEIERVDVLYGPFSAAYAGNSVGAVVDFVTRMPSRLEAHARVGLSVEDFHLYDVQRSFVARHASASLGQRWGRLSAWVSLNRLDSDAHPVGFATLPVSSAGSPTGSPVTGAIGGRNPRGQPWWLVGDTGQTDTTQSLAKLKLAWDVDEHVRLSALLGSWHNGAFRDAHSWLRDGQGDAVFAGPVDIEGRGYVLPASALALQRADQSHRIAALSLRRRGGSGLEYSLSVSRYDYLRDDVRSPTVALPMAASGGAGRIADGEGTGWTTANASASWRVNARHQFEFGLQQDRHRLRNEVFNATDWRSGPPESRFAAFAGDTRLSGAFVQDRWAASRRWTTVAGLRWEQWQAGNGLLASANSQARFADRSAQSWSPKAAIEFAPGRTWKLKASLGRAVRYPTVSELYQGSLVAGEVVNNDPALKPERSTTSELSWVGEVGPARLRATWFHETTRDALYSQTNVTVAPVVTNVQNVGLIRTDGLELSADVMGLFEGRLDLIGSATFAQSIIEENDAFPASVGRWQPRVPRWRANLVATWRPGERATFTAALRYGGRQFNTLDNVDHHSYAYTGTSPFLVMDVRAVVKLDAHWSVAGGVDNLGDRTYWNFHPYNQRTWQLEMRYGL